jgi:hypothetical protein
VLVAHPAGIRGKEYHSKDKRVKEEPREERRDDESADETARKPKITIALFGLENRRRYEKKGEYNNVSEVSFADVMDECRGNAYKFDFNSRMRRRSLYQRYLKEDGRKGEYHFLLANCLEVEDPDHDKSLRSHMGAHPLTMLSCASYLSKKQYDDIAKKLTGWFDKGEGRDDLIIIAVCEVEKHRSVAAEELLRQYLLSYVDIIDLEVDETKGDLARLCEEDCPSCSWGNPMVLL